MQQQQNCIGQTCSVYYQGAVATITLNTLNQWQLSGFNPTQVSYEQVMRMVSEENPALLTHVTTHLPAVPQLLPGAKALKLELRPLANGVHPNSMSEDEYNQYTSGYFK